MLYPCTRPTRNAVENDDDRICGVMVRQNSQRSTFFRNCWKNPKNIHNTIVCQNDTPISTAKLLNSTTTQPCDTNWVKAATYYQGCQSYNFNTHSLTRQHNKWTKRQWHHANDVPARKTKKMFMFTMTVIAAVIILFQKVDVLFDMSIQFWCNSNIW